MKILFGFILGFLISFLIFYEPYEHTRTHNLITAFEIGKLERKISTQDDEIRSLKFWIEHYKFIANMEETRANISTAMFQHVIKVDSLRRSK